MQGVCINPGPTVTLQEGETYFLFEHGLNNYLVSRFNNPGAHFGSYEKKFFEVIQEEQPEPANLWPLKRRYKAEVSSKRAAYRLGERFIIGPAKNEPYFNVYLLDNPERGPIGSYIHNFFNILEPYEEPDIKPEPKPIELRQEKPIAKSITKTQKPRKKVEFEQLSIFEFIG
ncbi:hypothetical protein [Peribacillus asahii]|uniref:hypothetical protein n=1 Tax=Peribacillus asahii TaxID=228899 RepID=UPI002079BD66|nr:hypothetical protein [Peribacillus asahii]USK61310.1 hypothetical protein LIT37_08345 [Peribacillus asahii]